MQEKDGDLSYRSVLLSTFVIKKKRCRVYFHRGTLIWETERPPYTRWTLPLTDVLTANYGQEKISDFEVNNRLKNERKDYVATSSTLTTAKTNLSTSFVLHYAARGKKNKWSHHSVTMNHDDHRQVNSWVKTIRNFLKTSSQQCPELHYGAGQGIPAQPRGCHVVQYSYRSDLAPPNFLFSLNQAEPETKQLQLHKIHLRNHDGITDEDPGKRFLEDMFFVNPYGGKKKGLEIWEKQVQPLMNIAGIETKVVVTERAGHISDTLLTSELDNYHAAVCIGGDGTFSELFNGLIARAARDQRIDLNDPNVLLPKPSLPVGVIPSGSTDTLAYSLHGTTDVETAVIHIIFGDSTGLDLSSVHSDKNLLRIYASILSYGYLGDVVRDSEKFRWMGPQRYDYSGFKKIIANRGYEGEVVLLTDSDHPAACSKCIKNCTRCIERTHSSNTINKISTWLTVKGKFFMVNGANISCACSKSPMGFSPHCHIGDGCVDVILVRHTSLINNIRMLLRLSSKDKTLYDLPFVEVYRAREFTFRASDSLGLEFPVDNESNSRSQLSNSALSVWNCDGEVIDASSVKIRVHCQLLKVFSRRMLASTTKSSSCFCLL